MSGLRRHVVAECAKDVREAHNADPMGKHLGRQLGKRRVGVGGNEGSRHQFVDAAVVRVFIGLEQMVRV